MSVYCHRIIEYRNKDGQWVRCGEFIDNFHGFNNWNNEDYRDRGFPEGHTIKQDEIVSDDGNEYVWGKSYVTLEELNTWVDKEKENSVKYLYSEINNCFHNRTAAKLDDILNYIVDKKLPSDNKEDEDDYYDKEFDIMKDISYFESTALDITETHDQLYCELIKAWALVDQVKDKEGEYWIEPSRARIVFYFD